MSTIFNMSHIEKITKKETNSRKNGFGAHHSNCLAGIVCVMQSSQTIRAFHLNYWNPCLPSHKIYHRCTKFSNMICKVKCKLLNLIEYINVNILYIFNYCLKISASDCVTVNGGTLLSCGYSMMRPCPWKYQIFLHMNIVYISYFLYSNNINIYLNVLTLSMCVLLVWLTGLSSSKRIANAYIVWRPFCVCLNVQW